MKKNKHIIMITFFAIVLITSVTLGEAAPNGISESTIIEAAKGWIGVKELHGGNNTSGIDCSHLVYQVYKQVGVKGIEFQTVKNMKINEHYITVTSPNPGDLIFWRKDIIENGTKYWLEGHVGIFLGEDQFIHTNNTVTIDTINGIYKKGKPYYARWYSIKEEIINSDDVFSIKYLHELERVLGLGKVKKYYTEL